jgi:hypothetical protein
MGVAMLSTVYSNTSADVYTLNLYDDAEANQMLACPSEFKIIGLVLAVPAPESV